MSKLVKTSRELAISAVDQKEWVKDDNFILCRVPLKMLSAGCSQNLTDTGEIVVDINKNKLSAFAANFKPKWLVLAGADKVRELKATGAKHYDCWVSISAAKELGLSAASQAADMGTNQLQQELRSLLDAQAKNARKSETDPIDWAYIVETYPDGKYFVYQKRGVLWKQSYNIVGKSQLVSFAGAPVRVKVTYSELSAAATTMDDTTYVKTYGAKTSEANTGMCKHMGNTDEALRMYSEAKRTGKWIPQLTNAFPISATNVPIAADAFRALSARGEVPQDFIVADFLRWQERMLATSPVAKLVDGKYLHASAFAVVKDPQDPSTWNVPLNTEDRVRKAFEYTSKHKIKADVREKVLAAAAQYNLRLV